MTWIFAWILLTHILSLIKSSPTENIIGYTSMDTKKLINVMIANQNNMEKNFDSLQSKYDALVMGQTNMESEMKQLQMTHKREQRHFHNEMNVVKKLLDQVLHQNAILRKNNSELLAKQNIFEKAVNMKINQIHKTFGSLKKTGKTFDEHLLPNIAGDSTVDGFKKRQDNVAGERMTKHITSNISLYNHDNSTNDNLKLKNIERKQLLPNQSKRLLIPGKPLHQLNYHTNTI